MIACDTNLLVHAHRRDSADHEAAAGALRTLAEGSAVWAIPWPCVHEFLAIATHPRIYDPPSTPEQALAQVEAWMGSPSLRLLGERDGHWRHLRGLVADGNIRGPMVHDALIAALCLSHGVRTLWSADRDFSRFPSLQVHNPLIGG